MTVLEKPTRRKIFYGMVVLFAVLAPLVLLYSRGYVFDFRNRGLVSTGGIFVKTVQSGTEVFIDSDFGKETSLISHGLLVTDLEPRRYTIRVNKEGFKPWEKSARVSGQEVLEFRNVFLPPEKIEPRVMFNVRRDTPARLASLIDRPEIGLEVGDPSKPFTVFLVNPDTGLARFNFARVTRWFWDANSDSLIIGRKSEGRMRWYHVASLSDSGAKEELITFRGLPTGFSAESVWPHPNDTNELYFFAGGALFLQGRSSVPVPIAEQIHSFAIASKHIYFISKNGFFSESDLNGGNTKILGRKGLFLDEAKPAKIIVSPAEDIAVLDSSGGLFSYRPGKDEELKLVSGNVLSVDFSASGDRMLLWNDHRLWLYWFRDNSDQPFDLADTKKQIFYSDQPIMSGFLNANGSYAFFSTAEGLNMVETDNRGNTNSYALVKAAVNSFALDKKTPALYWLERSQLMQAKLR